MNSFFYDLHIHSCASPCADDDMTPANIAGMASLQGLQIVALTDHNTSKNCPAFFVHAKKYGIVPIPGMELTTAEDIHVICLFPTLESAMDFDCIVSERLVQIPNRPDIFGNQYVMDENDQVKEEITPLLINATNIPLEEAYTLVHQMGGACYPAHIDRESNGIVTILGTFPEEPPYTSFELNDQSSYETYLHDYPILTGRSFIVSSDAHQLWKINEAVHSLELDDEPYSSSKVRQSLIRFLRGE